MRHDQLVVMIDSVPESVIIEFQYIDEPVLLGNEIIIFFRVLWRGLDLGRFRTKRGAKRGGYSSLKRIYNFGSLVQATDILFKLGHCADEEISDF